MNLSSRTYLDRAAGASGNPSSPHEEGLRAKKILEDARTIIARLVEVRSDDIIFTSGATEANALAILGCVRALRAAGKKNMRVLYLPSAHSSIVGNMKLLAEEGVSVEALPVKNYQVDIEALKKIIKEETALVSMDAVCGETGVIWNTRDVSNILRDKKIILHVDAGQAPLTEKISRAHFSADMLTFDSSKVGATRGVGALIAHRTIPILPLYKGGGQERGLRPGSESSKSARNFADNLSVAVRDREKFRASAELERERLITFITSAIPNVCINENPSADGQAPHILNFSLPGRDTDYIVALLDEAGFAVSTRSACETDSEDGSRAVLALTGDKERARATLRISWGPSISSREFVRFGKALARAVSFIDNGNRG